MLTAAYLSSTLKDMIPFALLVANPVVPSARPVRPYRRQASLTAMWEALDDFYWTYQSLIHAVGVNAILALSVYVVLAVASSLSSSRLHGVGAYTGALLTVKFGVPFGLAMLASALVPALLALVVGGRRCGSPASTSPSRRSGSARSPASVPQLGLCRRGARSLGHPGARRGCGDLWDAGGAARRPHAGGALRVGRAMEAMREDEAAAGVMGVNLPRYRLVALVVSSAMAGVAGCLSAHVSSFIGPNEYGFEAAVTILSYALLGGIGSPLAPVLGSTILTLLPEVLRPLADFRLMVNGMIIVLAVLFMPRGILPWRIARTG